MSDRRAAQRFHPGELIAEELKARGWSIQDLSREAKLSMATLSEIISGDANVNAFVAMHLGRAFGTSAQFWVNLQAIYDEWRVNHE